MANVTALATNPNFQPPTPPPSRDPEAHRRAALKIVRVARGVEHPGDCQACEDEGCHIYVGFECDWARKMLGLVSLLVGDYCSDEGEAEHVKAMEMASDLLRRMIRDINSHVGGRSPLFPLQYPTIDTWAPRRPAARAVASLAIREGV